MPALQLDIGIEEEETAEATNEFSGSSFKMINFIIDVPVRLDHILARSGDPWVLQSGSICYLGCEFQVVDQETAYLNEQGENSHAKYKVRQAERVSDRLMWGLLRERRRRGDTRAPRSLRMARKPRAVSKLDRAHGQSLPAAPVPPRRKARPPRPELPVALQARMPPPTHEPVPLDPADYLSEEDSLMQASPISRE